MSGRIVVVGSLNMDLTLACPQLPRAGETVIGNNFATAPGGKGANQAVAAARLGAQVSLVGCVGSDAFGGAAYAALRAEGVDITHLSVIAGSSTGIAIVLVEGSGENCIALAPGANAALSIAHIDAAAELIRGAALLICQLESPLPTVRHAIALACSAGVPVLLNPAPAQDLPDELLRQIDVLVPNASEAGLLTGRPVDSAADASRAAARLHASGVSIVLVTLGAAGVLSVDAGGSAHHAAAPAQAIDTTGAGDTFVGAFAVASIEGQSLRASIAFAQRAAAFSVSRRGAQASMPRRSELSGGAATASRAR